MRKELTERQALIIASCAVALLAAVFASLDGSRTSACSRPRRKEMRYRDGVLGIDTLRSGFTVDFRAMQLRLE